MALPVRTLTLLVLTAGFLSLTLAGVAESPGTGAAEDATHLVSTGSVTEAIFSVSATSDRSSADSIEALSETAAESPNNVALPLFAVGSKPKAGESLGSCICYPVCVCPARCECSAGIRICGYAAGKACFPEMCFSFPICPL